MHTTISQKLYKVTHTIPCKLYIAKHTIPCKLYIVKHTIPHKLYIVKHIIPHKRYMVKHTIPHMWYMVKHKFPHKLYMAKEMTGLVMKEHIYQWNEQFITEVTVIMEKTNFAPNGNIKQLNYVFSIKETYLSVKCKSSAEGHY